LQSVVVNDRSTFDSANDDTERRQRLVGWCYLEQQVLSARNRARRNNRDLIRPESLHVNVTDTAQTSTSVL
jgi:hypothetical protein